MTRRGLALAALYFFLGARASQAGDAARSMANLPPVIAVTGRNPHATRDCPAGSFRHTELANFTKKEKSFGKFACQCRVPRILNLL